MVQKIGYDKAAACAKKAHKEGSTLKASIFSGFSAVCVNVQILSIQFVNLAYFIFHPSSHYKILALAAAQIFRKVLKLSCKKVYNTTILHLSISNCVYSPIKGFYTFTTNWRHATLLSLERQQVTSMLNVNNFQDVESKTMHVFPGTFYRKPLWVSAISRSKNLMNGLIPRRCWDLHNEIQ